MIAIDTNVLVTLWQADIEASGAARAGLKQARREGGLMISAPVYSELRAGPGREEGFIDRFLHTTEILVDWEFPEPLWRRAGGEYQAYRATLGRRQPPRRILADFLIAVHAAWRCGRLLTMDRGMSRLGVSGLEIVVV